MEDYEERLLSSVDCKIEGLKAIGSDANYGIPIENDKQCEEIIPHLSEETSVVIANENREIIEEVPHVSRYSTEEPISEGIHFIDLTSMTNVQIDGSNEIIKDVPRKQNWSCTLKKPPNTKLLGTPKQNKKRNAGFNEKFEVVAEEKLTLIKNEMDYLYKDEERKIAMHKKYIESLECENARKMERHKLKLQILQVELENRQYSTVQEHT